GARDHERRTPWKSPIRPTASARAPRVDAPAPKPSRAAAAIAAPAPLDASAVAVVPTDEPAGSVAARSGLGAIDLQRVAVQLDAVRPLDGLVGRRRARVADE